MPLTKNELIAERDQLLKQRAVFLRAQAEFTDRIKATDGAIEMTNVFINRLEAAEKQDAADAAAKAEAEAKLNQPAETDKPKADPEDQPPAQKRPLKERLSRGEELTKQDAA